MYIGGDYYTDATVTPILTPGRSPGAITPKRYANKQDNLLDEDKGFVSPRFTAIDNVEGFDKLQ